MRDIISLRLRAIGGGVSHFFRFNGLVYSAAIAFNLLLSSIPVLFLVFAATSLFIGRDELPFAQLSEMLKETFPYGAQVLVPNLNHLLKSGATFGIVGTLLLLFSSFTATDAVHKSLSVLMNRGEKKRLGRSALFHVALVVVLTLLTGAAIVAPPMWRAIAYLTKSLPAHIDKVFLLFHALFSLLVIPSLLFLGAFLSYRYLSPGGVRRASDAVFGSILFLALTYTIKWGFVFYVAKFSKLSLIYGSLFSIVSFIIIAYLFAAAYLFCACVIGILDSGNEGGAPPGEDRPR